MCLSVFKVSFKQLFFYSLLFYACIFFTFYIYCFIRPSLFCSHVREVPRTAALANPWCNTDDFHLSIGINHLEIPQCSVGATGFFPARTKPSQGFSIKKFSQPKVEMVISFRVYCGLKKEGVLLTPCHCKCSDLFSVREDGGQVG